MSIKHILAPVSGGDHASQLPLRALELAIQLSAHVTATDLTVSPTDYPVTTGIGTVGIAYIDVYRQLQAIQVAECARARAFFDAGIAATRVPMADTPLCAAASAMWIDSSVPGARLVTLGRLADLMLMTVPSRGNQTPSSGPVEMNALEDALFTIRRPVLIPTGGTIRRDSAAIAWNGSAEAANAVKSAIDLLNPGAKITVIQAGEIPRDGASAESLLDYLGWHCFVPELRRIADPPKATATAILNEAKAAGAAVLIMGAYSHSRLRERILGGVTKYMLAQADIALFLGH